MSLDSAWDSQYWWWSLCSFVGNKSRLKCDLCSCNYTLCLVCKVVSCCNQEDIVKSKATAIPAFSSIFSIFFSPPFPPPPNFLFCTVGFVKKLATQNWYFKLMENSRTRDSTRFIIFGELFLQRNFEEKVVNIWTSVSLKFWGYVVRSIIFLLLLCLF